MQSLIACRRTKLGIWRDLAIAREQGWAFNDLDAAPAYLRGCPYRLEKGENTPDDTGKETLGVRR